MNIFVKIILCRRYTIFLKLLIDSLNKFSQIQAPHKKNYLMLSMPQHKFPIGLCVVTKCDHFSLRYFPNCIVNNKLNIFCIFFYFIIKYVTKSGVKKSGHTHQVPLLYLCHTLFNNACPFHHKSKWMYIWMLSLPTRLQN